MSQLDRDFTVIDATGIVGVRKVISNPMVITGYVNVKGVGMVPYEGGLERDFLEVADFTGKVAFVSSQPLRIDFKEGLHTRYTPDYLIQFKELDGRPTPSPILFEIKPREELKAKWEELRPGFRRASDLCRSRGWRFRIATDRQIRSPALANIKFLRRYQFLPDTKELGHRMYLAIRELRVTTPSELLAYCFSNKETRMEAVAMLWMLVSDRRIRVDMHKPLTMESEIWWMLHDGA